MQLGFVIDQDRCIGCHACTVACKAENDVPVGSFRTWVKYTETGEFPDIRRNFLVQRCNHCSDAPCVTICPVRALSKRDDGIVDVDRDACIGCRACMQACPYDAIYLNDDLGAVEKCHFCAHRVEVGLDPACVNVCPVNAIIPGDFDDPESRVSLLVLNNETAARRPEQGTSPNVRYIGAEPTALRPGAAARPPTYIWSDVPPTRPEAWPEELETVPHAAVVLDVGHRVEWGWHVSLYLVTKGIGAGAAMLAPVAGWFALSRDGIAPEITALVFTLITCLLLTMDLTRPLAVYRMLTRANPRSWLVRGAVVLTLFTVVCALAAAARLAGAGTPADVLRWLGVPLGAAAAGYTALLFAQCKGRDLWESPLVLAHLLVQAVMCGGAVLLAISPGAYSFGPANSAGFAIVALAIAGHVALSVWERRRAHPTDNARQAAAFLSTIRVGPFRAYRDGLVLCAAGGLLALLLLPALAWVPVLAGLYLFEHAFIRAGQLPPLS